MFCPAPVHPTSFLPDQPLDHSAYLPQPLPGVHRLLHQPAERGGQRHQQCHPELRVRWSRRRAKLLQLHHAGQLSVPLLHLCRVIRVRQGGGGRQGGRWQGQGVDGRGIRYILMRCALPYSVIDDHHRMRCALL